MCHLDFTREENEKEFLEKCLKHWDNSGGMSYYRGEEIVEEVFAEVQHRVEKLRKPKFRVEGFGVDYITDEDVTKVILEAIEHEASVYYMRDDGNLELIFNRWLSDKDLSFLLAKYHLRIFTGKRGRCLQNTITKRTYNLRRC